MLVKMHEEEITCIFALIVARFSVRTSESLDKIDLNFIIYTRRVLTMNIFST